MSRLELTLAALLAVSPLAGCTSSDAPPGSPPTEDAAPTEDTSGADTTTVDSTTVDSTVLDSTVLDSTEVDSGTGSDTSLDDASPTDDADDAAVDAPYLRPDAITVPSLPAFDAAVLPKDEAGVPTLAQGTGIRVVLDGTTKGPVNALAGCAALISGCYQPGVRTLDACVISMPICATAEPWKEASPCCPTACVERYETMRKAGTPAQAAAYTMLFKSPRCIPGLDVALGGKP